MWTVERFPQLRPALWRTFYRALGAYSRRSVSCLLGMAAFSLSNKESNDTFHIVK